VRGEKSVQPVTVGVIGLGRAGWDLHVADLRRSPRHYRVVAAVDADAARRRQAERELQCVVYDDYRAMLKTTAAELIVVASPSFMHTEQAVAACRAGRHVVMEKPMAVTLRDVDRIIAAAKAAGRIIFPYHRRRFMPEFDFLKKILREKKIGRCFHIGFSYHFYGRRNDWQCLRQYGGGQLNNTGSHFLDLILALLDSPVRDVLCDMQQIASAGDAEDHVKLLLRTAKGMTADMEISGGAATTRPSPAWTLLGTRGAATVDSGKIVVKYYDKKAAKPVRLDRQLAVPGRQYIRDRGIPWHVVRSTMPQAAAGGSFYEAVYATLRKNKPFSVKPEEVREMIRVIDLCRRQNPAFLLQNGRGSRTKH